MDNRKVIDRLISEMLNEQNIKGDLNYTIYDEMVQFDIRERDGRIYYLLNDQQNQIISLLYVVFKSVEHCWYIKFSWTEGNYRNKGYHKKLKKEFESWVKRNSPYKLIKTEVSSTNKLMLSLNQKSGYEIKKLIMYKNVDE